MKSQTVKTKPTPTASEAFSAIRYQLIGMSFVYHTLCRLISQKTKCDYDHAENLAAEMLWKKWIVTAPPIGLTETPTFKLADQ